MCLGTIYSLPAFITLQPATVSVSFTQEETQLEGVYAATLEGSAMDAINLKAIHRQYDKRRLT
jgi:hypothetical protein